MSAFHALLAGSALFLSTAATAQDGSTSPLPALTTGAASAASSQGEAGEDKKSTFDRIWSVTSLVKDDDSEGLNELRVVGRFHLDNYIIDSDNGDASDLVVRRARLGIRGRAFKNIEAHVEGEFDLEGGRFFSRLTDAYVAYKFSDAAKLTAGKHSVKFTLDGATSSNDLLAIDRSNVANNFWFTDEYAPGVSLGGKSGKWSYTTGVYSGGRKNRGFGDFDGGVFWLGSLGHDFGSKVGLKKALVRVDYVYNDPDPDADFTRPFKHIGTLALVAEGKKAGFSGELTSGKGSFSQSDAFGITAMPWYSVTDKLQLVGRYTFLDSEENNGLRLARYDNVVTSGRGDRYHELYGGLNYYIYGTKLKAQTGLAYARMRDRADDGGRHDGVSWTTALRVSW
jgi:phosphate-selective porin OprO/OprP